MQSLFLALVLKDRLDFHSGGMVITWKFTTERQRAKQACKLTVQVANYIQSHALAYSVLKAWQEDSGKEDWGRSYTAISNKNDHASAGSVVGE